MPLFEAAPPSPKQRGNDMKDCDNYGKPKKDYLARLAGMSDAELGSECESKIWLSAYANNNPRSDFHWQCDACYDAAKARGRIDIYSNAHKRVSA